MCTLQVYITTRHLRQFKGFLIHLIKIKKNGSWFSIQREKSHHTTKYALLLPLSEKLIKLPFPFHPKTAQQKFRPSTFLFLTTSINFPHPNRNQNINKSKKQKQVCMPLIELRKVRRLVFGQSTVDYSPVIPPC